MIPTPSLLSDAEALEKKLRRRHSIVGFVHLCPRCDENIPCTALRAADLLAELLPRLREWAEFKPFDEYGHAKRHLLFDAERALFTTLTTPRTKEEK